jgi:hypothetical protein
VKWVHPLKGRKITEAMADALDVCAGKDGYKTTEIFNEGQFWRNGPYEIAYHGVASWGYIHNVGRSNPIHSWDSMRDCLKYGFTVGTDGCVVATDTDWHRKQEERRAKDGGNA